MIKSGCFADLTVFDEEELKLAQPDRNCAFGIRSVWINGQRVLQDGVLQEELLGSTGRAIGI